MKSIQFHLDKEEEDNLKMLKKSLGYTWKQLLLSTLEQHTISGSEVESPEDTEEDE